jgi:hypothetical protein
VAPFDEGNAASAGQEPCSAPSGSRHEFVQTAEIWVRNHSSDSATRIAMSRTELRASSFGRIQCKGGHSVLPADQRPPKLGRPAHGDQFQLTQTEVGLTTGANALRSVPSKPSLVSVCWVRSKTQPTDAGNARRRSVEIPPLPRPPACWPARSIAIGAHNLPVVTIKCGRSHG